MRPKQPEILATPAQFPRAYVRIPKPVSAGVENVSHSPLYFTLPIRNLCKQGNFAQFLQECFFLFVTLHTLRESSVFVSLSRHNPLSLSFAVDVFLVC